LGLDDSKIIREYGGVPSDLFDEKNMQEECMVEIPMQF
jgi:hypothetical protein